MGGFAGWLLFKFAGLEKPTVDVFAEEGFGGREGAGCAGGRVGRGGGGGDGGGGGGRGGF